MHTCLHIMVTYTYMVTYMVAHMVTYTYTYTTCLQHICYIHISYGYIHIHGYIQHIQFIHIYSAYTYTHGYIQYMVAYTYTHSYIYIHGWQHIYVTYTKVPYTLQQLTRGHLHMCGTELTKCREPHIVLSGNIRL